MNKVGELKPKLSCKSLMNFWKESGAEIDPQYLNFGLGDAPNFLCCRYFSVAGCQIESPSHIETKQSQRKKYPTVRNHFCPLCFGLYKTCRYHSVLFCPVIKHLDQVEANLAPQPPNNPDATTTAPTKPSTSSAPNSNVGANASAAKPKSPTPPPAPPASDDVTMAESYASVAKKG